MLQLSSEISKTWRFMVSKEVVLKARTRDEIGKQLNTLRAAGDTPAVVHDHGKSSIHIAVPQKELKRAFEAVGKHAPVNLSVDNKQYVVLIKDVTYRPATQIINHTVFQAIKADEKVSAEIPVKLSAEIPAERAGLLVLKKLDHLMVEALPKDLIDSVEVDASSLKEAGDKLQVSDVRLPDTITITLDSETVIATVEVPKDQIAEADAALEEQAQADAQTAEQSVDSEAAKESSEESKEAESKE